ncbi:hypothetical protein C3477_23255 [Mycobacterium kansasii]|uniref:helix-turn-helix domain-containing protein n=1 Tax=Mycobacterium kansasii TaxID=1768 RepID=UPI000CDE1F8C|nr:hypothetical protein C3B43_20235 [Mycobacterium kansasii]POX98791.1 hypothetical protein C3477_23255 [Mycobacterium kansasii]POY16397.1 hypothetical protein C3476_22830 [Mycobacterium kansasii]
MQDGARAPRFISTTKVAKQLDISPNLLRRLIYDGQLKAIQVGRLIRVDAASLDEFIAQNTFGA